MSGVNVKSEIKPLKKVLLHRPGKELLNLTPNTLEELLFDDIPFLKVAQEEHDAFAQALRDNGVEVFYLEDLMAEVLEANPELREQFLKQWIEEAGIRTDRYQKIIFDYMQENYPDAKDFVLKTMEGINLTELHTDKSNSLVDLVSESSKMVIKPMPNLYFTRDPFAMIGNGVSINRMYSETRNRETIYGEYIFAHHPMLKGTPEYYSRYNTFHIEGGDILNINDKVLAIGENIQIRRFVRYAEGVNVPYIHMGGKIGVLVNLAVEGIEAGKVIELGKDVAMQIAAMNPAFLDKSDVSQETLDKEKEIQLAMMANDPKMAAKPEKVKEGIVMGKLGKYYEENCLLQQAFVKENKISVEKHVAAVAKELGGQITVKAFTRFATGEGIEKKEDDFAAEVASMIH